MSGAALIRAARQLISDEEKWTQDAEARKANADQVRPEAETAISFDMVGALQKLTNFKTKEGCDDYFAAISALKDWLPRGEDLFSFNDSHGHSDVLDLMDRAAGAADAEQASEPVPESVSSILRRLAPYRPAGTRKRDAA